MEVSFFYILTGAVIAISVWRIIVTVKREEPDTADGKNLAVTKTSKKNTAQVVPRASPAQVVPRASPAQVVQKKIAIKNHPDKIYATNKIIENKDVFDQDIIKSDQRYDVSSMDFLTKSKEKKMDINELKRELVLTELEIINDELARTKKQLADYKNKQKRKT